MEGVITDVGTQKWVPTKPSLNCIRWYKVRVHARCCIQRRSFVATPPQRSIRRHAPIFAVLLIRKVPNVSRYWCCVRRYRWIVPWLQANSVSVSVKSTYVYYFTICVTISALIVIDLRSKNGACLFVHFIIPLPPYRNTYLILPYISLRHVS